MVEMRHADRTEEEEVWHVEEVPSFLSPAARIIRQSLKARFLRRFLEDKTMPG